MIHTIKNRTPHAIAVHALGALASVAALIMACGNARAESSVVDLTYSPSQSNMMSTIGFGIYKLKDAGPGFYLNGSVSGNPDSYYYGNCYYSCGSATSTQQGATLFSVGATFPLVTSDMKVPIYRTLHSYVGVGYGSLSGYAQYSDSYWYDYSSKDESGVNANGGLIFGFDGFALNVGVNSLSKAVYFGIGINTDKK